MLDLFDEYGACSRQAEEYARPIATSDIPTHDVKSLAQSDYPIATAYPKKDPLWKPKGVRVWRGSRVPAQPSSSQSARTAQGQEAEASKTPPLDPLAGQTYKDITSADNKGQQRFMLQFFSEGLFVFLHLKINFCGDVVQYFLPLLGR